MLNLKSETNSCEKWRFFVIASVSRIKESKHQNFRDHDSNTLVHTYLSKSEFFLLYVHHEWGGCRNKMYGKEDSFGRSLLRKCAKSQQRRQKILPLPSWWTESCIKAAGSSCARDIRQLGAAAHAARQLGAAAHALTLRIRQTAVAKMALQGNVLLLRQADQ